MRKKVRVNQVSDLNFLRDPVREHNILTTTHGADVPQIAKDIDSLAEVSQVKTLEMELVLDQTVRGDASLLSNMDNPEIAGFVNRLRERAEKADKAAEAWEKDSASFIDTVLRDAERRLPEGSKEKVEAALRASTKFKNRKSDMSVTRAMKQARVRREMTSGPTEVINVPERYNIDRSGKQVPNPYIVSIEGVAWKLGFGQQKVPKIVAQRFREMLRDMEAEEKRKSVMASNLDYHTLQHKLNSMGG